MAGNLERVARAIANDRRIDNDSRNGACLALGMAVGNILKAVNALEHKDLP